MSCTIPTPRQVGNALAVLLALPPAVLQVLAERIVDRLDDLDAPGMDMEPDHDGEADHDTEAPPDAEGPWWAPCKGPADCGPLRLAGAA